MSREEGGGNGDSQELILERYKLQVLAFFFQKLCPKRGVFVKNSHELSNYLDIMAKYGQSI